MPKFFVGAIFFTVISWALFVIYGTFVGPDMLLGIGLFYLLLLVSLGLTFSFPLFYLFKSRAIPDTEPKKIYKKSFKYGMYLSFGLVGFLILKTLDLLNPINMGLFGLFYIVLFLQIKAKK